MKVLKRMILIVACSSLMYLVLSAVLPYTKLSLRTWADVLGKIMTELILPFLILVIITLWVQQTDKIHLMLKGILTIAVMAVYGVGAFCVVFAILFGVQEERRISQTLLVTNEAIFLQESRYDYYRPVALFFKTPAELTTEVKISYLEDKYGREFMEDTLSDAEICDKEFPDVKVCVYLESMKLKDDYINGRVLRYLTKGYQSLKMERDFEITKVYDDRNGFFGLRLDGEEDIAALAEDISRLICLVVDETDFFAEQRGILYFLCGEGDNQTKKALPFGKLSKGDGLPDNYYRDVDQIEKIIREWYGIHTKKLYQSDNQQRKDVHTKPQKSDVEDAAEVLYAAVFAEEGYSYKLCFNAKGNLYIDLGTKEEYQYLLVYDRISKNGSCKLFVLYRSSEDSSNDAIVDMYAVEEETKKVIASGKKRWSDVGTKEYRELTGE